MSHPSFAFCTTTYLRFHTFNHILDVWNTQHKKVRHYWELHFKVVGLQPKLQATIMGACESIRSLSDKETRHSLQTSIRKILHKDICLYDVLKNPIDPKSETSWPIDTILLLPMDWRSHGDRRKIILSDKAQCHLTECFVLRGMCIGKEIKDRAVVTVNSDLCHAIRRNYLITN